MRLKGVDLEATLMIQKWTSYFQVRKSLLCYDAHSGLYIFICPIYLTGNRYQLVKISGFDEYGNIKMKTAVLLTHYIYPVSTHRCAIYVDNDNAGQGVFVKKCKAMHTKLKQCSQRYLHFHDKLPYYADIARDSEDIFVNKSAFWNAYWPQNVDWTYPAL